MTRTLPAALAIVLAACAPKAPRAPIEASGPLRLLPLAGPLTARDAEISGMAWYGDKLILLPQYPERFGSVLFSLSKADILAQVDGRRTGPLETTEVPFDPANAAALPGYEGFESIVFFGASRACLTVETSAARIVAYLVCGTMGNDGQLRLDSRRVPIPSPAVLANMSHEALVVAGDSIVALFEANGPRVNPKPVAHVFGLDLMPRRTATFPSLEYRVSDATPLDREGRFWVTNVFWIGDNHLFGGDRSVERLIELQWKDGIVARTATPEIVLPTIDNETTRNWEAIARLDDRGFLIATDRHPETLLAFVPRHAP
jgi:hypothetical protein